MVRVLFFIFVIALYVGVANSEISLDDLRSYIKFNLFSRSNENSLVRIRIDDAVNVNFDAKRPTKIIIHGFTANANIDWVLDMKNRYLLTKDVNVFTLDWEKFSSFFDGYNNVRANTKDVGGYLAQFIDFLATKWTMSVDSVHCVGHSFGAHICGYAGKALKFGKIHRISGLDPAGKLYSEDLPNERLAPTDAVFVDALHTATNGLGFVPQVGHVDIYANGGAASQPGCAIAELFLFGVCSHLRSYEYFTESIVATPETPPIARKFIAKKCSDTWLGTSRRTACTGDAAIVGEIIDETVRGIFYLPTASQSPFALN